MRTERGTPFMNPYCWIFGPHLGRYQPRKDKEGENLYRWVKRAQRVNTWTCWATQLWDRRSHALHCHCHPSKPTVGRKHEKTHHNRRRNHRFIGDSWCQQKLCQGSPFATWGLVQTNCVSPINHKCFPSHLQPPLPRLNTGASFFHNSLRKSQPVDHRAVVSAIQHVVQRTAVRQRLANIGGAS